MLQIFISYSSKNRDVVKRLIEDLESLGHHVWFDQELTGGHIWWEQVLSQIHECDLFIFALTPEALNSYPCKLEYTYAFDLHKTILPVLVADGVSINLLPPALSKIQLLDNRQQDRQSALALSKALNNLPKPQPLPNPLPKQPETPISYLGNLKDQIEIPTTLNFQEQTALLIKLKERLGNVDEFPDVLSLLERLQNRDDLFAKVANEINTLIAEASARGSLVDSVQSRVASQIKEPKSEKRKPSQEEAELLSVSNNKEITSFLIRTYENWLSGAVAFAGGGHKSYAEKQGLKNFVAEQQSLYKNHLQAASRAGAFAEDEYLVGTAGLSCVLTNRTLYIFTKNDLSGPVIPIGLREISVYKTQFGWITGTIHIVLKSGRQLKFERMKHYIKEDYVYGFINR